MTTGKEDCLKNKHLSNILQSLRSGLSESLGYQLEAVYLYGSQARGDAYVDSDIDVLVVVRGNFNYFDLVEKTGQLVSDLSLEYETVISLAFVSQADFSQRRTPFLLNVRREGIII